MKSIYYLALLLVVLFTACKKENDPNPPTASGGLLSQITIVDGQDTSVEYLTYNADTSLQSFSSADGYISSYTYLPQLIVIRQILPGVPDPIEIDSVFLDANQYPVFHKNLITSGNVVTTKAYTYDANGNLSTIITNMPMWSVIDTTYCTWSNGNMTQQTSASGILGGSVWYWSFSSAPTKQGDILHLNALSQFGKMLKGGRNTNLCTGATIDAATTQYLYGYDAAGRIASLTTVEDMDTVQQLFYQYQ